MKQFKIPQMTLVHLAGENVIYSSICNGFVCDNCECTGYQGCEWGFVCKTLYNCESYVLP